MALTKKNTTLIIIAAAVGIILLIKIFLSGSAVSMDPVSARTQGPEQAKVNIVEFIDFECPACAYGSLKLKEYIANNPGSIRLQVKYFPLMNIHRHALQAATYVECVSRQGKFWPFFDPMMSNQAQWSALINVEGIFDQMAKDAGVNMNQLKSCLSSEDISQKIMSEKAVGQSMGVQSTPTYFINKKMVVGAKSLVDELNNYFPPAK